MENILRHNGYAERTVIDMCLAAQAIGVMCLWSKAGTLFRVLIAACAFSAALFGIISVVQMLQSPHFEGYVLTIGAALIAECALTLVILFRLPKSKLA